MVRCDHSHRSWLVGRLSTPYGTAHHEARTLVWVHGVWVLWVCRRGLFTALSHGRLGTLALSGWRQLKSPVSGILLTGPWPPGVHRAEAGHREDVCHEVHEQAAMHRARRGPQRLPGAGDPAGDRACLPGEPLVSPPRACQGCPSGMGQGALLFFGSNTAGMLSSLTAAKSFLPPPSLQLLCSEPTGSRGPWCAGICIDSPRVC